jgi:hypothetical protein
MAELGLSRASVHTRASALRKAGVRLKRFPRGRKNAALDVAALNELLERLGGLDDASESAPEPPAAKKTSVKPKKRC